MLLTLTINPHRFSGYDLCSYAHGWCCNLWNTGSTKLRMIREQKRSNSIYFTLVSSYLTLLLDVLLEFTHLVYFNVFELLIVQTLLFTSTQREAAILQLSIGNLLFLHCRLYIKRVLRRLRLRFMYLINRKVSIAIVNIIATLSLTRTNHCFK